MRNTRLWAWVAAFIAICAAAYFYFFNPLAPQQPTINVLAWTGYEEPQLTQAFEKATGIRVNVKTYVGGDQMYSIFSTTKNTYDAVIVDTEYLKPLHDAGRLSALEANSLNYTGYFPYFVTFPSAHFGGETFGVPVRFGVNGIVYNTDHFSEQDVQSYAVLMSDRAKGHVGIWDWYLPSMGVLSKAVGNHDAYNLTEAQYISLLKEMRELRPQVAAIHPTPPDMIAALADGRTWLVPGVGDWVASVLEAQGKHIDWAVPKEGGIMWVETLTIPSDAPHRELAKKYLEWMMSPQAQAILTQLHAYNSNATNRLTYTFLTAAQRHRLKADSDKNVEAMIENLSLRELPKAQDPRRWQNDWQGFKANTLH